MMEQPPSPFKFKKYQDCPDAHKHAKRFPKDFDDETGLSKTHVQVRCPTCGFFAQWIPRKQATHEQLTEGA